MGFFKCLDMPKKEHGEALNTADRSYLIKLIVVSTIFGVSLTLAGMQLLLERHISRMDQSAQKMMKWSKKADFANEMLEDLFRVQQQKEAYERQGVGAEEAIININKQEVGNEKQN